MEVTREDLLKLAEEAGAYQYGFVETADICLEQEVRRMCEVNSCGQYGKSWACPPALGTVEECRARLQAYKTLLVFSVKCDLDDSFDYEGMLAGGKRFKEICRAVDQAAEPLLEKYLILSNEGCGLCKECSYPDKPCRFPQRAHGALEGYGIMVSRLAAQAGIRYINGANTVTYFGGLAF